MNMHSRDEDYNILFFISFSLSLSRYFLLYANTRFLSIYILYMYTIYTTATR